jgi:hypothetical protein
MSGGGGDGKGDSWREEPKPTSKPKRDREGKGGGGGELPTAPCNIHQTTALNSPNRTVITGLRTGDILDVVFQPGPPQKLLANTSSGATAGSITSSLMPQIIRCIQDGYSYVAEVVSVQGAVCQVQIRPQ